MNRTRKMNELRINKRGQSYVFRYRRGEEKNLLDAIVAVVKSPDTDFDWIDAAILTLRISPQIIAQARSSGDSEFIHLGGEITRAMVRLFGGGI